MRLLIDTNVILDMIFNRKNSDLSVEVFKKAEREGCGAYITASTVTDLFYIIHKETHDTKQTYQILDNIFSLVSILPVSSNDIYNAFREKWTDFEDCVQCKVAQSNKIDCVITGNKKDYKQALLPIMTPQEYLQ